MTPEGKVKDACKRLLKQHGIWYYMPVQNGMGVVGIPDIIACWKGQFLAIETKAPGKLSNVTPNQQNTINEINRNGGWAIVVDDADKLATFIVTKILEKRIG
jgi:VRR-NUC domain